MTISKCDNKDIDHADNWYQQGRYFNYGDHKIFYRDSDFDDLSALYSRSPIDSKSVAKDTTTQKPVLLLLHGFPTCSWDFAAIWPQLTKDFRLITLDFLGFGCSDKPKIEYSIFLQANITQALLSQLDIEKHHILCHDFGDTVAIELLIRLQETESIQSLVLTNGGIFADFHQPLPIQKLLASRLGKFIAPMIGFKQFRHSMDRIFSVPLTEQKLQQYWQLLNLQQGKRVFPLLIRYMKERIKYQQRWEGGLANTLVPTGLIAGSDDPISGSQMITRFRQIKPDETTIAMENTGHYPHLERPSQFVKHLVKFYQNLNTKET
ncbi:alpha/beta fold hydrolase [Thalassotalea litorea]|uniref:alpha/beta fold hydrolase n=1 Tax=Thalassotalea litorea TaxID=2020715 RepID=UPI0037364593